MSRMPAIDTARGRLYKKVIKVNYIVSGKRHPIRNAYLRVNHYLTTK